MSGAWTEEYGGAATSWTDDCEDYADPNIVCEYQYYDENAAEWDAEDAYCHGYGASASWLESEDAFFKVSDSAQPCRNGEFCKFFAQGKCKYFHPEEDTITPQAKQLQGDLQELRKALQGLLNQLPSRKTSRAANPPRATSSTEAVLQPTGCVKQPQQKKGRAAIVIDLSESRSRSRSPVGRRIADSDEDTQDSDQILADALQTALQPQERGVSKALDKQAPALPRGRRQSRQTTKQDNSRTSMIVQDLTTMMAPIVQ